MSVEKKSRHSFCFRGLPQTPLETFPDESFKASKNFKMKNMEEHY